MILILTGTESCGKSTLFNELRKTLPGKVWSNTEFAAKVIKKRLEKGCFLPWERDFNKYAWEGFEHEMFNEFVHAANKADINFDSDILLLDRAAEDILAYASVLNMDPYIWWRNTKDILKCCPGAYKSQNIKYKVFVLQPVESVVNNELRYCSWEKEKEHKAILEIYNHIYSSSEIIVEKTPQSIQNRVKWVLENINI